MSHFKFDWRIGEALSREDGRNTILVEYGDYYNEK